MNLLLVSVVVLSVASLSAGQLTSTFQYSQQFGRASLDDNRTFRLKQVPVAAQQEFIFPVQPEVSAAVIPAATIVAPIPVVRSINTPVVTVPEPVAVAPVQKTRRVVKKVRVAQDKPALVDSVTFPETPRAAAIASIQHEQVPITRTTFDEEKLLREADEAKNAHYSFSSSVQDTINDHAISRSETRDGLALTGMYSYSDGFFKRTVHYQADQDGYRVLK